MAAINLTTHDIFFEREEKSAMPGYAIRAALFAFLLVLFVRRETSASHIAAVSALAGVPLCVAAASVLLHLKKIRRKTLPAIAVITDNLFLAGLTLFTALVTRTMTTAGPWGFDIPYTAIAVILILVTLPVFIPLFPAASGATAAIIYAGGTFCFRSLLLPAGQAHPQLMPAIAVFPAIIIAAGVIPAATAYSVRRESARIVRDHITQTNFARFFPPRIAKRICRDGQEMRLSAVSADFNAAVMSIGIRSFPLLCEKRKSGEILSVLSSYYSHIPAIIIEHGGTIHSFCGDEIVASFGAPSPKDDDAAEAVLTAASLAESVSIINESFAENELPEIEIGIGIHFGPVSAAVVGTEERMEYTLIGSALSVARKLREACSAAEKSVLVSKGLVDVLREDFAFSKLGSATLKETGSTIDFYNPAAE